MKIILHVWHMQCYSFCKPWGGHARILGTQSKIGSPRSGGVSAGTGEGVAVDAVLGLVFDFPPFAGSGLRKTRFGLGALSINLQA